jgi:hypothetical protein
MAGGTYFLSFFLYLIVFNTCIASTQNSRCGESHFTAHRNSLPPAGFMTDPLTLSKRRSTNNTKLAVSSASPGSLFPVTVQ